MMNSLRVPSSCEPLCSEVPNLQRPLAPISTEQIMVDAASRDEDTQCHQLEQGDMPSSLMQSHPSRYPTRRRRRHPFWHLLASRSFYSVSSISMILVNKSLDKGYHHFIKGDLSILLIVFQSIIALACLESCRRRIHGTGKMFTFFPNASISTGIFFCSMLVTGMASLQTNTLSMIIVSRNFANLLQMVVEAIMTRKRPDRRMAAVYCVLLAVAVAAAWKHHDFELCTREGTLWMVAHCICTSAYVVSMKRCAASAMHGSYQSPSSTHDNKMNLLGVVLGNHVLCVLLLLPMAYAMGEIQLFVETTAIHTTEYATKIILAGLLCFLFNFALMHCVEPSPTSSIHEPPRRCRKLLI